jgi:prevent-host-death family protein
MVYDAAMSVKISVSDAKGQLTELVRRAEAGEDVVLTRHGHDVIRLAPVKAVRKPGTRRRILEEISASAAAKATPGPSAARSQDFLYGDDGMPK